MHENEKLKKKLEFLERAKSMSGAVGITTLKNENVQMKKDLDLYRKESAREIKRLQKYEEETSRSLITTQSDFNKTTTSFKSMESVDIEDMRRTLAELSIQLETEKKSNKSSISLTTKEI